MITEGKINFEITNKEYFEHYNEILRGFLFENKISNPEIAILGNGCGIM